MADLLLRGGRIYSPSEPFADSLLISGDRIAWIGQSEATGVHVVPTIELEGALVTPAFVDAHVHSTSAGLQLLSLDLTNCTSLADLLSKLERHARALRGAPVIGHGWDESTWPEQRPPTNIELDRATAGSVVYLSRIDVHSAVISSSAQLLVQEAETVDGWSPDGLVKAAAHGVVRTQLLHQMQAGAMSQAQEAFFNHCIQHGIASIHECGGPEIAGETDFQAVAARAHDIGIGLVRYWGEAGENGIARAKELGANGVGGDLFIDGSIGSRTAALHQPYIDESSLGNLYLDVDQVADHLKRATDAGLQAGFHAIGDRALDTISQALRQLDSANDLKGLRHRVEHAEMLSEADFQLWRDNGIVMSAQPLFDQLWASRMYPARLGPSRSRMMNRFASIMATGVTVAFGSDAPVTKSSPWEWVRAAVHHSQPRERITARAAFNAATRGGRRAAHHDDAGVISVGAVADLAIWQTDEVIVQTPDPRIASWSTDERAGVPGLPVLEYDHPLPTCLATIIGGRVVYRA